MGGGTQGSLLTLNNFESNNSYDFWDPQHWMLDGLVDFNYNTFVPIESA
jgi:hypothetical protein